MTASVADTVKIVLEVIGPSFLKGTIIRRPNIVGIVERFGLDARGVKRMQALRKTYGNGPLKLNVPIISRALVMTPEDVRQVLDQTPNPYSPASAEKRKALSQFEPENVLITRGPKREVRRAFHEHVLETDKRVHRFGETFVNVATEEAASLLESVDANGGELAWPEFEDAWYRVIRRVVFGDWARNETELTDRIIALRREGNWSSFRPIQKKRRAEFLSLMEEWLAKAEPGSLGARIASAPVTEDTEVANQVPQWLFAFDPGGMTVFRSLAVLATHPEAMADARRELAEDETARTDLQYLRTTIVETLRLWPTTPLLLRQSTAETWWPDGSLPAETGMIIFEPYFHRDGERLEFADRFSPEVWDGTSVMPELAFVPFSGGPGICPANNLVPMVTSAMLGALVDGREYEVVSRQKRALNPDKPLPGTLNNFGLRFRTSRAT